jgi:hypothetical protein
MKRLFLCAAVFMAAAVFNEVNAQAVSATTQPTLNVTLSDIQSIVVNNADIDLNFTTPSNYSNGVRNTLMNHLTVTSSGKFIVKVKAAGTHLTKSATATGSPIPVSTISLTPTLAGTTFGTSTPTTITALTNADQTLYANTEGTTSSSINVSYKAAGGADYLNRTGSFTTTLTYTISPE